MLRTVLQDLRYGLRTMRASPLFFGAAILTLSLGLGATIAIYSVINGVLLRPLDYPAEDRLVHVRGPQSSRHAMGFGDYEEIARGARSFAQTAVWQGWTVSVRDAEGVPTRIGGASVSSSFFQVLGTRPQLGRLFGPEHDGPAHEQVVLLSDAAWRGYYGTRPDILDQLIRVDSTSYRVLGVLPANFVDPVNNNLSGAVPFLVRAEPPAFARGRNEPGWIAFWTIARLREGASVAQANAEVERLMAARYPNFAQRQPLLVQSLRATLVEPIRPTLFALLAAVVFVLLIGCANVANLLLSRASARVQEIALRTTLGASRSRLVAQLLTEGVLLATLAGVVGLALALAGTRVVVRVFAAQLPRAEQVSIDWRVALFALALATASALVFALAPALQLTGGSNAQRLREGGRGAISNRTGRRLRHSLVVLETALAVVLWTGAGLLLRTFWQLQSTGTGFDARSVFFMRVGLPYPAIATTQEQELAVNDALVALTRLPGVAGAGAISDLPMSGAINSTGINRTDRPAEAEGATLSALVRAVAGDYFRTMGITVSRGRMFTPADRSGALEVALVNEEFARRMFPGEDALGKSVRVRNVERQIVGIVSSVKEFTVAGDLNPALYTPYAQEQQAWMRETMTFVVRSGAGASNTARRALRTANPELTVSQPRALQSVLDADVATPRLRAWLVLTFAVLAVLLAGLGIGSVLAYTVTQRVPEIGVRLALGAAPAEVVRLVVSESARLAGVGVALGAVGALAAGRLISRFLYGVQPADPFALVLGTSILMLVALAASWLPARRGARVEPASVLRG